MGTQSGLGEESRETNRTDLLLNQEADAATLEKVDSLSL